MSDVQAVQPGSEAASETAALENQATLTVSEAARLLGSQRAKRDEEEQAPAAPVEAAAEQPKSEAQADDAAPPKEATGETQVIDPVEEQPLELPRSWSKEKAAIWTKLDREAQQYVLEHDSEVSKGVRNAQNEAAEQRKAADAERQVAEQTRQQYEAALPILLQQLHDAHMGEFSDVKSIDDVTRLATDDPVRYLKWDAQQKRLAAISQQQQAAQQRQTDDYRKQWSDFAAKQDQLLLDRVPELKDKTRAAKVADSAKQVLKDHGFTDEEMGRLWNGEQALSLRDARLQLLLLDGVKYREAKSALKPAPKPVPQVQRPGVAQPKGADDSIQALKEAFERSPTVKNAAALQRAERSARAA